MGRALHVARIGFAVACAAVEREARRGVHDLADVRLDPLQGRGGKPESRHRDVPREDHRPRHLDARHLTPVVEEFIDPRFSASSLAATDEHGDLPALRREIPQQEAAQEAGGAREQNAG